MSEKRLDSDYDTLTISRRDFIKLTGITSLCMCATVLGISACTDWSDISPIPLAANGSYRVEGERLIITLNTIPILNTAGNAVRLDLSKGDEDGLKLLILRSSMDSYHVYADRCTHNGKELDYSPTKVRLICRSRRSHFDLQGERIKGPAESALVIYPCRLIGEELVIELDQSRFPLLKLPRNI